MIEKLVQIKSLYAAILDEQSPVNVPNFMHELLVIAERQAKTDRNEWATLFYFNSLLNQYAQEGSLLAWTMLFNGVYKVSLDLLSSNISVVTENINNLDEKNAILSCPSGRIIIDCLDRVGNLERKPIISVEPGTYFIKVNINTSEESKHEFLESLIEYPIDDGPDWFVEIQKVTPCSQK